VLKQVNFRSVAEMLTVATTASFLVSALLQEAIFAFWGIDFTAVASLEDVALGGLRFLGIGILSWIGTISIYLIFSVFQHGNIGTVPTRLHTAIRTILVAALSLSILVAAGLYAKLLPRPVSFATRTILFFGLMLYYSICMTLINYFTSSKTFRNFFTIRRESIKESSYRVLVLGIIAVMLSVDFYRSPYLTLDISVADDIPELCTRGRPPHRKVLWIGTRAVVLRCAQGTYVYFPGEHPYSFTVRKIVNYQGRTSPAPLPH
jgi:hypothetical protein